VTVDNRDDAAFLAGRGVSGSAGIEVTAGAGVDPTEFEMSPEPPSPPLRVVLPSRMLWSKGVGVFVEAAALLRAKGVPVEMQLVGGVDLGSRDAVPPGQLERWHTEGAVQWLGFRADMPAVLRAANVVCLPTLYREGLPRALTEGALTCRSLVTTDVPGCREIVRHEETGLLVPAGDAEALAAAIARLAVDGGLRQRLGVRARALALERFAQSRVIERTLGIYERLLGLPGGALQTPAAGIECAA
jgi:glycosyltransferase involved in cell wall biosynthesis